MNAEKKRVFITVKTYPNISDKYAELVCTAGILEDGTWIRLYPVPFRLLKKEQQYKKYTWINVETTRSSNDFRNESYRPTLPSLTVETGPSRPDWNERRRIILENGEVFTNLQTIIDKAKTEKMSLATFKPTKITDFVATPDARDWDAQKLANLQMKSQQMSLFDTAEEVEAEFRAVRKIPYKFYYLFEDDAGKKSRLMIEDWEIGMLYLHCLESTNGDEKAAIGKVKEKYFGEFLKKDLYFFLGTTLKHHNVSRNPFIIIGVFCPPPLSPNEQLKLF